MIKFSQPSDWDFGMPAAALLTDSRKQLQKRASAVEDLKFERTPNQTDVHVIGLGAYEGTGENRNYDLFKESECRRNHHYFKQADRAFHRHHKNKPSDPKFGNIKASAYNEAQKRIELIIGLDNDKCSDILDELEKKGTFDVSMACFLQDAKVWMADGTEKELKDVLVGDTVLSHLGHALPVTDTFNKSYTGAAIRIKAAGLCEEILCTEEHPIWARLKVRATLACPVCSQKFKNLRAHLWQKTDAQHQYAYKNLATQFDQWCYAKDLAIGDFVTTPFSTEVRGDASEEYARLLGWYLAEGHVYVSDNVPKSNHSLDFTLNLAEEQQAKEIESYLRACGASPESIRHYTYPRTHKRVVRCRDMTMAARLAADGGRYSYGKHLSEEVKHWLPATQKLVLESWLSGDGTFDINDRSLRGTTVSKQLMRDLCVLAYRNNLIPSVNVNKANGTSRKRASYVLYFTPLEADKLNVYKKPKDFSSRPTQTVRDMSKLQPWQDGQLCVIQARQHKVFTYIEGNLVYRQIRKISVEHISDTVYDITVPGDDSFVVSGIGVHNSRQAHDVCTFCLHKAANDASRCEHIPKQLGEINSQGVKCAMENPDPRWFEMSYVGRRADRIGIALKCASAHAPMLPRDYVQIYGPVWEPPMSYFSISKKAAVKRQLLSKLSALEKHVEGVAQAPSNTPRDKYLQAAAQDKETGPIPTEVMDELRKEDPSKVFKQLADNGITLSPEDFTRYLFGSRLKSDRVKGMKTLLPSIFNDLEESEEKGEVLNDEKFEPSPLDSLPKPIKKLIEGLTSSHSMFGAPAHARVMRITIIKKLPDKLEKTPAKEERSKEAADHELARAYGAYKLAALNYLDEQNKLDDELLYNTILQNRY